MNKKLAALVAAVAILASIHPAEAQAPAKVRKVGFLAQGGGPGIPVELLRQGLRELSWVEGQNLVIEYRSAEARSRLAELAAELVRENVEVIVAQGPAAGPAKMATTVIPIVFGYSGDPIEAGYIVSLARPGGNMTGITWLAFELVGKRLELLKEAAPRISRVAVLANPAHPGEQRELKETQIAAQTVGTTLQYHQVRAGGDFDAAFDAISKGHANALLVFPDALTSAHRKRIAEFAVKHRLPSVFGRQEAVEAGGLMSYGPDQSDAYRRMAVYVDKILKGAKPADLPAELPRKFELVINLKAAKQIGLTIPQSVLYRADKVIK
jgi:putative tryptophan/tyrosine transport system substrate-binding protein